MMIKLEHPTIQSKQNSLRTILNFLRRNFVILLLVIIILLLIFFYIKEKSDNKVLADQSLQMAESKQIRDELANILLFPDKIEPTIATIVDVEKLKKENATFYKDSVNGDKIVIFPDKIVIYRSSSKKIVNVTGFAKKDDKK